MENSFKIIVPDDVVSPGIKHSIKVPSSLDFNESIRDEDSLSNEVSEFGICHKSCDSWDDRKTVSNANMYECKVCRIDLPDEGYYLCEFCIRKGVHSVHKEFFVPWDPILPKLGEDVR